MAKSIRFFDWSIPMLLFGTTLLTGCSLIGLGVGSLADPGQPGQSVPIRDSLKYLERGTKVFVLREDRSMVKCEYKGVVPIPDTISESAYARQFEQWRLQRNRDTSWIPPYGSSIQVRVNVPVGRTLYVGHFAGFDRGRLRVACPPLGTILPFKTEYVADIRDSVGQVIAEVDAVYRVLKDVPPDRVQVTYIPRVILDGGSDGLVNYDSILAVYLPEPSSGKWVGLSIGAALDIAVIVSLIDYSAHYHPL